MTALALRVSLVALCGALACSTGCLGPLVELDCAPDREPCAGRCVPRGTCRATSTCGSGGCADAAGPGGADAGPAPELRDSGSGTGDADAGTPITRPSAPAPTSPVPPPRLPPGAGPTCASPLVACGNGCVDLDTDADHCGACGRACPTAICRDGLCEASYPGHLVVLGHDLRVVRDAPARLLANAVLLAPSAEVRVATFVGTARPGAVSGAWRAIDARAAATGRVVRRLDVDEVSVLATLDSVDVLFVPSQAGTPAARLDALGVAWGEPLARFLGRGGVVVVLDGGGDETWRLVSAGGLLAVTGSRDVTGEIVSVAAAADAIATGVPLRYRAERSSSCFDTAEPGVVVLASCGPVALHRTLVAR